MKNSIVLWMLCLFSSFICAVTIGAADISYPEDNAGILYGYTPGPFTSTDSSTDLAIDGIGFFILRDSEAEENFYTKIGNFDFDDNGYLVSSHGYIVNGWEVSVDTDTDQIETTGAVTDIQIPSVDKSNISIDEKGTIFEQDALNTLMPRFRVALAKFYDPHRLEEVEDNLFKETSDSGVATTYFPGSSGLGTIKNYSLEEIDPDFSYEADIWVDGEGYFIVRDPDLSDTIYYLVSDAFRINKNGQLVSSGDLVVQGWELVTSDITGEAESAGAVSDIAFQSFTSPPEPSDHITVVANIDADSVNHSVGVNALSFAWDGSLDLDSPIANSAYEHQVTLSMYDLLGSAHDISIYFDNADAAKTVEFIVTCIPVEDIRFTSNPGIDTGHGLLGRGTISFTTEGVFADMTFERLVLSDPFAAGAWESQDVSTDLTNQHFTLIADFLGGVDTAMDIEVDFGTGYDGGTWISEECSTTYNLQSSSTISKSSNGYGAQALTRVLIDEAGVIMAYYTEGLVLPRFQVALASFQEESALNAVDPGIFEETSGSGSPTVSPPGKNGFGVLIFDDIENVGGSTDDSPNDGSDKNSCFINSVIY